MKVGDQKCAYLRPDHVKVPIFFQLKFDRFLAEGFTQGQLHPGAAAHGAEQRLPGKTLRSNREIRNPTIKTTLSGGLKDQDQVYRVSKALRLTRAQH